MSNARNLANLLGTGTQITTADIADGAFQANKNLIINGAMQVAQWGNVSINDVNAYGGPDRFVTWVNGTTATVNVSQSNNAPDGFANSYRIETTSAGNFNAGSSYQIWGQIFEGQNLQGLAFGTSSAKTVTASFWVRSSQTGIMNIEFRNQSASKHNISQYTISSANTWEYKTITFTGDTASGFANSNALGAYLIHWGKSGSSFNTGTAPTNGWVNLSATNFAAGATLDYISGVGRYIEFTGIQLELGDTATPFEHRSYGEELARCQRYYTSSFSGETTVGGSHPANYAGKAFSWCDQYGSSPDRVAFNWNWSVQMRATPTITMYGNQWTAARVSRYNGGNTEYTIDYASGSSRNGLGGYYDVAAGATGDFVVAYVEADAEL